MHPLTLLPPLTLRRDAAGTQEDAPELRALDAKAADGDVAEGAVAPILPRVPPKAEDTPLDAVLAEPPVDLSGASLRRGHAVDVGEMMPMKIMPMPGVGSGRLFSPSQRFKNRATRARPPSNFATTPRGRDVEERMLVYAASRPLTLGAVRRDGACRVSIRNM